MNILKISNLDNFKNSKKNNYKHKNIVFESRPLSTKVVKNTVSVNFFKKMFVGELTLSILKKFKKQRANNINSILEQYDKILSPVQLKKNINFNNANTVEEGIDFAKNVLKIKEIDKSISLEAINYLNKCIVDVSNANNGKLTMPSKIIYGFKSLGKKYKDSMIAVVVIDSNDGDFGSLLIEKNNFNNKVLDNYLLTDCFLEDGEKAFNIKNGKLLEACMIASGHIIIPDKKLVSLIEKYYNNPEKISTEEKRIIHYGLNSNGNFVKNTYRVKADSYYQLIYHEMGHLQDLSKNYKRYIEEGKDSDYRWIHKNKLNKSFINRNYNLRRFYSEEEQKIVSKISQYSKVCIGEFIAETYADFILGKPIPPEVMALYKKYNGPMLNK